MDMDPKVTPEFLAWTLARPCALKNFDSWDQPERAERHLRSAREYGEALRDARCDGDVCYDRRQSPSQFFSIRETLRIYGGAEQVAAACSGCPANVLEQLRSGGLAGCYGELPLAQPAPEFYERIEAMIERFDLRDAVARLFPATKPRWFGLWMKPIIGEAADVLARVVDAADLPIGDERWALLRRALAVAAGGTIPLHAIHYPRGEVEARRWKLAPHCVHCHAEIADYRRPCPCCGQLTKQMPTLTRHLRGDRPWQRLPASRFADSPPPSAPG